MSARTRPTLAELRTWPATVTVTDAARALGISRAYAYTQVAEGGFPARTIKIGARVMVATSSIIALIEGEG